MQRYSSLIERLRNAPAPGLNMGAVPSPLNPVTGVYGSGKVSFLTETGTFVVPSGCTKIRVRGWSPGGGRGVAGGTISFGAYASATGGGTHVDTPAGGVATGGDINRNGGAGDSLYGPGSVGNLFHPGFTNNKVGRPGFTGAPGEPGRTDAIDFIGTGGSGQMPASGSRPNDCTNGANGGAGASALGSGWEPGLGGFPGGGAGHTYSSPHSTSLGGGGAFFLKEITGLTPGASIAVTIPAAPTGAGGGLIIVEW